MRIQPTQPRHWLILGRSSLFFLVGALIRLFLGRARGRRPQVVLFEATFRPTIWQVAEAHRSAFPDSTRFLVTSFDRQHLKQVVKEHSDWVEPIPLDTLRGAIALARSHVAIFADRPRSLGILAWLTDLPIIDVWHGISYKPIKRPSFLRRYREVWVASEFLADTYQRIAKVPRHKLRVLGHSPLDKYVNESPSREELRRRLHLPASNAPVVAFGTTWDSHNPASPVPGLGSFGLDLFSRLSDWAIEQGVDVVIRNHHISGVAPQDAPPVFFRSQADYPSPVDLLKLADVFVTDWSSLAFEFAVMDKPAIFVDIPEKRPRRFFVGPEHRAGDIVSSTQGLFTALTNALKTPSDYLATHRDTLAAVREKIISDGKVGDASSRQAHALHELVVTRTRRPRGQR